MYTSIDEAKEKVWERWNNPQLRQKVLEYVGQLPPDFGIEPLAVLTRHVATPNFEFFVFEDSARKAGIKPVCFEYLGDKLSSKNPDKLSLVKPTFLDEKTSSQNAKIFKIVDLNSELGKSFNNVKTVWGEQLVSFHHRMLSLELPDIKCVDNAIWLRRVGSKPKQFYPYLLALFVCHGIMFENFISEGMEGEFTQKVVRPAMERVKEHFGLKPLIVRLHTLDHESHPKWCWYPIHLEENLKGLLTSPPPPSTNNQSIYSPSIRAVSCK